MKAINKIKAGSFKRLLVHHEGVNTCGDALGSVHRLAAPPAALKVPFLPETTVIRRKNTVWPPHRVLQ